MTADDLKRRAAARAVELVSDGMRLGLGTGSTAKHFVDLLGERVRGGLQVTCVATSVATETQAVAAGIRMTTLDEMPELDLAVDGADELDGHLQLIKGGGGALLREKIVASASARMIVIADDSKRVDVLGHFPLPIEVVPFGLGATRLGIERALAAAGCNGNLDLRQRDGKPYLTDGGHYILDAALGRIPDAPRLAGALAAVAGVVEHGLFIGLARGAILAGKDGVSELGTV